MSSARQFSLVLALVAAVPMPLASQLASPRGAGRSGSGSRSAPRRGASWARWSPTGRLAAIGLVVGLGGAYWATGLLRGLLFGVERLDPTTFAAVAGLLLGVAALASWVPARRVSRVNPVEALRHE